MVVWVIRVGRDRSHHAVRDGGCVLRTSRSCKRPAPRSHNVICERVYALVLLGVGRSPPNSGRANGGFEASAPPSLAILVVVG